MEGPKTDRTKAAKMYLYRNITNLALYVYFIVRVFNIDGFRRKTDSYHLFILVAIVLIGAYFGNQAKQLGGGMKNPIIENKTTRILLYGSIAVFLLGIFGSIAIQKEIIYLSFLSVPMQLAGIIMSAKHISENDPDSELLDDFEID